MTYGDSSRTDSSLAVEPDVSDLSSKPSESTSALNQPASANNRDHVSTNNGDHVSQSSSFTRPSDSPTEDERLRLLNELEVSVDQYRKGSSSKTEAISSILRILSENTDVSGSQSQKESTFDSYLSEIISVQQPLRGHPKSDPPLSSSKNPTSVPETSEKRTPQDWEDDDSGDEEDKRVKRQKLNESDMPWYNSSDESTADLIHPSSQETRRLLRIYHGDISKSKFYAKIAPNSPTGIPSIRKNDLCPRPS
ncbi:hypothetical protein BYT27DRAFT_7335831 [Phlegmacium glaucopus]|nr:hypothetical protein BYT27DRAFT_7335831 [Phlegmacium glaucopus]